MKLSEQPPDIAAYLRSVGVCAEGYSVCKEPDPHWHCERCTRAWPADVTACCQPREGA
jgi:hypothetical protein